ncbi:MAG: DUF3598 family protein [Synechococcaceae cyanobacterium RM1_1_27]|nr:DUF3598 family protein [Synechococcaceae cyanobacterium SM2_3_2]NJO86197.1 DUF3598 family protein [Synechococcaceae cyanobacterium RM1_1_27]
MTFSQPYRSASQSLALHLGSWQGIFRDYDGSSLTLKSQKRSIITFTQPEPGSIHQSNIYLPMEADPTQPEGSGSSMGWLYRNYAAGLRFFQDGSFSNGRVQLAPFSDFGLEQGFLYQDQKARVVLLFDPAGSLTGLTTILETRDTLPALNPPSLTPEHLLGSWHGQATTFDAQDYTPTLAPISLTLTTMPTWTFPGRLWIEGTRQLPIPTQHRDRSFAISLGWIPAPGMLRQLVRRYDSTGAWSSVTLVEAQLH